jgi:hypothetical protein
MQYLPDQRVPVNQVIRVLCPAGNLLPSVYPGYALPHAHKYLYRIRQFSPYQQYSVAVLDYIPYYVTALIEKQEKRTEPQGIGVYFHVPGNYRVLEEVLTAKANKSNKFRYKASFSLPYLTYLT